MNKDLIPIGIPVIDEFIIGFPRNALILIIGEPGSGFISFLHQLLVKRSKEGIPLIYTSLDKSKDEIYHDLATFGWNLDQLSWDFIDQSPISKKEHSSTLKWDQDAINVVSHELFRKIQEYTSDTSIPVFDSCVNSLTIMLLQSKLNSILRFINEYSAAIKKSDGWHFMTMLRGVHGQEKEYIFSHYSDVVLEFAMRLNTKTRLYERVLGIKKLLGVDSRAFPIEYDKHGIRPITTSKIQ
jgi:KaiC/GvpD/RAD55 family RecA-like ATPase